MAKKLPTITMSEWQAEFARLNKIENDPNAKTMREIQAEIGLGRTQTLEFVRKAIEAGTLRKTQKRYVDSTGRQCRCPAYILVKEK